MATTFTPFVASADAATPLPVVARTLSSRRNEAASMHEASLERSANNFGRYVEAKMDLVTKLHRMNEDYMTTMNSFRVDLATASKDLATAYERIDEDERNHRDHAMNAAAAADDEDANVAMKAF
eukprot:CAMPEP_0178911510 /NCGR_PEP_ID=MMETSP0786-20121207/9740_1 /TAXON_ID=186022 /ORGANISM="Thalassionema frauenfeldii, Strain CCMP 1798" /LENGTH=123 /DNA_ID=CAMNT_0020583975 /DNA_START=738 /DNA_END=1109 /DNA_ORIENTATION=+